MNPVSRFLMPARLHKTMTTAQLNDNDGLVTVVATLATPVVYAAATLDGVLANPGPAILAFPMPLVVSTSASAATYNTTDPITVTGLDWYGEVLVEELTLAAAGGDEVLVGNSGFAVFTSIAVPAQLGVGGTFMFGVEGVIAPVGLPIRQVRHGSDGNIKVSFSGFGDTPAGRYTDTVPGLEGERHDALIHRIYGDAATTSTPVTFYF